MAFEPYRKYARSAYAPPHERVLSLLVNGERVYPSAKGWGPGWPACEDNKPPLTQIVVGGDVEIRVRTEAAELIRVLMETTELMGYDIRPQFKPDGTVWRCGGTHGFSCRPIKSPPGTPDRPSWHSWGLAVDINAPCNGQGTTWQSNIPPKVITLWESCGFYWGGRYKGWYDPMHFEYLGRPGDIVRDLKAARAAYAALVPVPEVPVKPEQVKLVQQLLNLLVEPDLEVDGVFGAATEAAVQKASTNVIELTARLTAAETNVAALEAARAANRLDGQRLVTIGTRIKNR